MLLPCTARQRALLTALLTGATMSACAGSAARDASHASDPPAGAAALDSMSANALLELARGACRGRCAQYRVVLFGDGTVFFDGGTHVHAVGVHRRTVATTQVQALLDRYRAPVLALSDSVYMEGERACGAFVADLPTIELVMRTDGAARRFTVNGGCRSAPALLWEFARAIDSVALAPGWIGGVMR